jgi:hypothetical protein
MISHNEYLDEYLLDEYDFGSWSLQFDKSAKVKELEKQENTATKTTYRFFGSYLSMVLTVLLFMFSLAIFGYAIYYVWDYTQMLRITLMLGPGNCYMIYRVFVISE